MKLIARHHPFVVPITAGLLAVASTCFSLQLTGSVHQPIVLWPVSGLLLGLLLSLQPLARRVLVASLAASAAGVLLGGLLAGMPWWLAGIIALCTALDLLLGYRMLGGRVASLEDMSVRANAGRLALAAFVLPMGSALLGAWPVSSVLGISVLRAVMQAFLANSLGIILLTPAVLYLLTDTSSWPVQTRRTQMRAGALALFLAAAVVVFWQNTLPVLFLLFPPMLLAILLGGMEAALFCSLAVAIIGSACTIMGHGPIRLVHGDAGARLLVLQLFVYTCLAKAIPLALLLVSRSRAEERLTHSLADREHLVEELRVNKERFEAFMDHSPMMAYIKDAEGRMCYYNRSVAELYSVSRQAWLGKTDYELWPREMAESYRRADIEVLRSGRRMEVEEHSILPDGRIQSWTSYKFPFRGTGGELYLAGVSLQSGHPKEIPAGEVA